MSRSTRASRRISASTVLSSRAALRVRNSWSARANQTLRRRRIAMCPSAVARCVLPTPTGPRTQAPRASSRKRRRAQLVPELAVEPDTGVGLEGLQPHGGVELGGAGAQLGRRAVAAVDLVGEHELQEVGVRAGARRGPA